MPVAIALVYVTILVIGLIYALSFGGVVAIAFTFAALAGAQLANVWRVERRHRHYAAHGGHR